MAELLLSCQGLTKAFGAAPLFEGLSFGLYEGDHVGVVGPNGSGKSTLMRLLAGLEPPDAGTRAPRRGLRVGYVAQDPSFPADATVESVLRQALAGERLEPQQASARLAVALGRCGLNEAAAPVRLLSGGWRKRLAVAEALVREPELLLLDEPTNHLDVAGIEWLEALLPSEPEAFVVVSHDRYFLEAVARRVIELDRAFPEGLLDVQGRYSEHLRRKDELLAGQAAYAESLRGRVRDELEWLSRKARARTRKAQARVDEAQRLQDELRVLEQRGRSGAVAIEFTATGRPSKRLLEVRGLCKAYGERRLLTGLDLVLTPGTRLGLLGGNGSGKSTLLRLLAGLEPPDQGTVERAERLRVVLFDQHREGLDPSHSLRRALAPHGDAVVHQGRSVHVAGWAKRFLFRTEQLDQPVGRLSGGERARVLIARLMLEPADLLLLDEPTNDLDIPTLEVLEESLLEFGGALVLVTHDRYLLDRVSNRILALDGRGGAPAYADYSQWEIARERTAPRTAATAPPRRPAAPPPLPSSAASRPRKLGYLEQREWDEMEQRILSAEETLESAQAAAAHPAVQTNPQALQERLAELESAQREVERLYARWAELEARIKA